MPTIHKVLITIALAVAALALSISYAPATVLNTAPLDGTRWLSGPTQYSQSFVPAPGFTEAWAAGLDRPSIYGGKAVAVCDVISVVEYLDSIKDIDGRTVVMGEDFKAFVADPDFQAWLVEFGVVLPEEIDGMAFIAAEMKPYPEGSGTLATVYLFTKDGCAGDWTMSIDAETLAKALDHEDAEPEAPEAPYVPYA